MFMNVLIFFSVFSFSTASLASKSFDKNVPCDRGWYYFRDKCYRAGARKASETLSWTRALTRCKSYGADLVSINSQEEQDFIVGFMLLDIKRSAWIGLNDRDKEQDFKWTDGSVYNYSIWNTNEPSTYGEKGIKGEDCVEMRLYPERREIGVWNDLNCEFKQAYICEKNANPRKSSPNPMYCIPEEGGGWKYQTSCYHIIQEKKEWQLAEKHCLNNYNGHLLTINDMLVDYFVELAIPDLKKEMWIGIQVKNQLQQKWTPGWYVSYEGFESEAKSIIEGTCVARKRRAEWVTMPCSNQLPFICEVSKAKPPVLKKPPLGAHCPKDLDDWRDFGGEYCYYIGTENVNFFQARFRCSRRGGDLVSIHSQEESDILQPFVRYKKEWVFIGLMRLLASNEETFAWLDGSKMDYQHWGHGEPDKEEEKCVQAGTSSMQWYDIPCENEWLGYICSVKKIIQNSTLDHLNNDCKNFCIAPSTYLYGLIRQSPDAEQTL